MACFLSRLVVLLACVLCVLQACDAACGRCPRNTWCSANQCQAKKGVLASCSKAVECASGICFKKKCRQVRRGAEQVQVTRTDPAWAAYKRSFAGRAEDVALACPPASAITTGIVQKLSLEDVECCYKAPGKSTCSVNGKFVRKVALSCWDIDAATTEPKAGGRAATQNGVSVNPLNVKPCPAAVSGLSTRVSVRSAAASQSSWNGKVGGFTEVWAGDASKVFLGGWPHSTCFRPASECRKSLKLGHPIILRCPTGTALAGVNLKVFRTPRGGPTNVGIDSIVCQDPLGFTATTSSS